MTTIADTTTRSLFDDLLEMSEPEPERPVAPPIRPAGRPPRPRPTPRPNLAAHRRRVTAPAPG